MKMKPASHAFLGLLAVTVVALSSSSGLAQVTTQISGTFAPSGNYSVNGNLFLIPRTTMQCNAAPERSDKVEVSGGAMLDGRLQVTMTGRFNRNRPARYTLLEARGGLMGKFSLVSIKWAIDQGLSARVTYDPKHVYLEIAFEPGGFPPPLDTQRPQEITPTPRTISKAGDADKPSSTANTVLRPTVAGLTFANRVAYQQAIEEVRWRHRIWPKENPDPKPSLDAVMSQAQIEKKVADYLHKSQLVADQRGWPISASELQAEMDRMASHTKRPDVLHELFEALGSDPSVIAECLARPVLAERLVSRAHLTVADRWNHGELERRCWVLNATAAPSANYMLPQISEGAGGCIDDSWTATTTANAPDARDDHTAVWTGSEMIVWGGFNFTSGRLNTGERYDPNTDSWISMSLNNAPSPRDYHSAVWTGSEMIVWGGEPILNTGGRYNPITDTWTATNTTNAATARGQHTAVWTGSEMIVWGGRDCCTWFNSGARYNPATDSWTATSTIDAPEARWLHTVEWTGSEMIVWGGTNGTIYLNTGGRYNPETDSWTATGVSNDVLGRAGHTAVWTGSEMIVWGGGDSTFNDCNTGGRYNPSTDSWMATSTTNAPSPRDSHTAVWTGGEMIVWGGVFCCPEIDFATGGRYNAGGDTWMATATADAPFARLGHTAVWTGSEIILWGGYNGPSNLFLNTGGRYCAQSGPTPSPTPTTTATPIATPSTTATATATATPTATATATPTSAPSATPTTTPTPTPRPTPTARPNLTPRFRPTPPPRP